MHKTKITKKLFALLLAQALVINMVSSNLAVQNVCAAEVQKEETVYIFTDQEGNVDHTIVSDKLTNEENKQQLQDETDLTDIENVTGDETFTQNGKEDVTWNAAGNEIAYQGKTNKALPVDVKISYTLDGKKISAKKLAGKSGKVTIRFDYKNHAKKTVRVNDKDYKVYVPFTMVSGVLLDSEKFANVTVKNGRTIKEGDNIIAVGCAVPGLKESLQLSGELNDIEIPEYVEITADVKDFSMGMSMTVASNDLLNELDLDLDSKADTIDSLEKATNELVDGTKQLRDGAQTAHDGSKKLADNMKKLTNGLNDYTAGVNILANGLLGDGTKENPGYLGGVEQLEQGAGVLKTGLDQIVAGTSALSQGTGAEALNQLAGGLQTANLLATSTQAKVAGAGTIITEAGNVVKAASKEINTQKKQVEEAKAQLKEEKQAWKQAAHTLDTTVDKTIEQMRAAKDALKSAETDEMKFTEQIAQINAQIQALQAKKGAADGCEPSDKDIAAITTDKMQAYADTMETISFDQVDLTKEKAGMTQISQTIAEKASQMSTNPMETLLAGLKSAQSGADALQQGAQKLTANHKTMRAGANTLKKASKTLINGATQLEEGSVQLESGLNELAEGSETLMHGMQEYKEEGIQKLLDLYHKDLEGLGDRFQAIQKAGQEYQIYTKLADGQNGTTKFIYKSEEIKDADCE